MAGSESDGKLATGNAVNEQANIPKVVSSPWLVKLLMLLNVIGALSNGFLAPHHQENGCTSDHPSQSNQSFLGGSRGDLIGILRPFCR
jgi:hypothetical protein